MIQNQTPYPSTRPQHQTCRRVAFIKTPLLYPVAADIPAALILSSYTTPATKPEDIAKCAAVLRTINPQRKTESLKTALLPYLHEEKKAITMAVDNSGVVRGFLARDFVDNRAEIHLLYVDPTCQKSGFGRNLVQTLFDQAHARGLKKATLYAEKSAIGFYAGLGFKIKQQHAEIDL
jgi:ribosomal protein S18 acetylase RimI-like enzyme